MKAVVLVGGFGTRLRPLTNHTPKNLLPVVHVPMVERVLTHLAANGVTEAVLSLGYRPDRFLAAYPDGSCAGVGLHYAVEDEPLDTAGAIRFAAEQAGIAERFLVVNGDVLTRLDVTRLVRFHEASDAEATVALHTVEDPSRFGVVVTDVAGRVEAFIEKPPAAEAPSRRINAGTYVLEPSVLKAIPSDRRVSVERETFPALVAKGTLYALDGDTYWLDAGTPETYLQANLDCLDGRGAADLAPSGDQMGTAVAIGVHPHAVIAPTASITRSVIDEGVQVGEGAVLVDAVVLPGAVIGAGCRVERSIVGPDAVLGAGAALTELCVVGAGETIEPGARLHSARVPEPD